MHIAIIGAGASGMAAALQAAWLGARVTLFERNATVGRKLLVTGSGRCNITNDTASMEKYTCADPQWMHALLNSFGVPDLLTMLRRIGIPTYATSDGWRYPLSNSAQSVVDTFKFAIRLAGVHLQVDTMVTSLSTSKEGFSLELAGGKTHPDGTFERVILSAGGKAYPSLGSRGELFPVLERLGHTVLPKRPALAPVLADLKLFKSLQGVRLDAGVELFDGDLRLASSAGNMIFTAWGLNGPAVMNISHHIRGTTDHKMSLSINFLKFVEQDFFDLLNRQRKTRVPLRFFLGAFLPPKAASLIPALHHLSADIPLCDVEDDILHTLVDRLQHTRLEVKGVRDFEYCQLSAGGVPVLEVDPQTLESRVVPGLYLTGETLDVVGLCGGYNLQYAFASGALAGRAAAS